MTNSRYAQDGLEERFIIERLDGQPINPTRRYGMVLDFSGSDPHAAKAAQAYAQLAADIEAAISDPAKAPKQHRY
jgi:hypothetical protein